MYFTCLCMFRKVLTTKTMTKNGYRGDRECAIGWVPGLAKVKIGVQIEVPQFSLRGSIVKFVRKWPHPTASFFHACSQTQHIRKYLQISTNLWHYVTNTYEKQHVCCVRPESLTWSIFSWKPTTMFSTMFFSPYALLCDLKFPSIRKEMVSPGGCHWYTWKGAFRNTKQN